VNGALLSLGPYRVVDAVMKILALSDVHGNLEALRRVREIVSGTADAIVFTGDIVKGKARGDEWLGAIAQRRQPDRRRGDIELECQEDASVYAEFFDFMGDWGLPTYVVPGNMDAPRRRYFETFWEEPTTGDFVHCVHGSPAFLCLVDRFLVAGVGGEIVERGGEDFFVLQIPRWEAEFLMFVVRHFEERKIFLFHTPPVGALDLDKGQHKGSRVVNDLIETYEPWLVFCGHAHNSRGKEMIGSTLVVNPGSLKAGNYAIVDSERREVEFRTLGG